MNLQNKPIDVDDPIYFLFAHAIELCLKSYVQAAVGQTEKTHDIWQLFILCRENGFKLGEIELAEAKNIIEGLNPVENNHGFRYFNMMSTGKPDGQWTMNFVNRLFENVEPQMILKNTENWGDCTSNEIKIDFTYKIEKISSVVPVSKNP